MKSQPSQKFLGMSHPPCSCSFCSYCWQDRQTDSPGQSKRPDPALHRAVRLAWSVAAKGVCLHFAARGDPWCQLPGALELTSLPGDRFQVAGASRQLAGVEPQAAATVRGLLAGPGLDAVAGVLQGEGKRWLQCPWQPGPAQSQLQHHSAAAR